jgi:hypothetical protein
MAFVKQLRIKWMVNCVMMNNDDCLNSICGFKMFNTMSDIICCPSNMTEHIITNFQGNFYCTGQVVGNPCGTNMLCASEACVNGIC